MKRIKCEWCGHPYDVFKNEKCPNCGGVYSKEMVIDTSSNGKHGPLFYIIFIITILLSLSWYSFNIFKLLSFEPSFIQIISISRKV